MNAVPLMRLDRLASMFLLAVALSLASLAACGTTPGRATAFPVLTETIGDGVFTTATGWRVTLEEAAISLGPIYVYAPDGDTTASLSRMLLPIARAHGGHDPFGTRRVRAELLEESAVDVLAGRRELGIASGSEGETSDLVIVLEPPRAASPLLRDRTMWISGIAEQGELVVPFEGGLDLPAEGISRRVEGVPMTATVDAHGQLVIGLRVARWLDQARFERLTARSGERFVIEAGDQVSNAWRLGVQHPDAFAASWEATTVTE